MPEPPVPPAPSGVADEAVDDTLHPLRLAALAGNTTLHEERNEILECVLGALAAHPPDPDEMAACSYLLKHLSETAARPVCIA
jgi:hypothetical protein